MENQSKSYQGFTELNVWKEPRNFQLFIFNLCKSFPPEEKFRLSDQLIRASRSVAANIAEGHGRYHFQEQIQFCRQARGSLSEVLNHIYTAFDYSYISNEQVKEIEHKSEILLKLINGYLFFLKNQKLNHSTNSTQ
ncbi:MAG: four helix bundle protein [Flavisolibacter sp.]|nr:four helix bundle protein [Flavisolibacter sp.]MBD0351683.1 four helix bundle protein [Flavisolibacter sp.]MBD0378255.1 four helix bundle protein [Flavisolibacter sp.]